MAIGWLALDQLRPAAQDYCCIVCLILQSTQKIDIFLGNNNSLSETHQVRHRRGGKPGETIRNLSEMMWGGHLRSAEDQESHNAVMHFSWEWSYCCQEDLSVTRIKRLYLNHDTDASKDKFSFSTELPIQVLGQQQ